MTTGFNSVDRGARRQRLLLLAYTAVTLAIIAALFVPLHLGAVFWGSPKPRVPAVDFIVAAGAIMAAFAATFRWPWRAGGPRAILWGSIAIAVLATALVATLSLRQFANSGDEYAYLFQSWTFEAGRLWNPAPRFGDLVASTYTWVAQGKWVGQYPPGWPLLIAGAARMGLPAWPVNAAMLAATALLLFDLVRRQADAQAAALAAAVFLLSPFSIFQAASFFSHVMAALLVVLAAWAYRRSVAEDRAGFALLAGVAIGLLGVTRTNSAMIAALPIGVALLVRLRWRHLIAMGIGGAPFLAALLVYQKAITGDFLTPVYYLGGRTVDHLYFDMESIRTGAGLTVGKAMETCLWIAPLALPLWLLGLAARAKGRTLDAVDAIYPLAILIFTFYPLDPGNRYGPRYYFDFWPLMLATIAGAAPLLSAYWRRVVAAGAVATIVYGLALLPFLAHDYRRIVIERDDPYRLAAALPRERAVVCVTEKSGMLPLAIADHARNGIAATAPVLFAHCEKRTPAAIRAAFPGYRIYTYDRAPGAATGRLISSAR